MSSQVSETEHQQSSYVKKLDDTLFPSKDMEWQPTPGPQQSRTPHENWTNNPNPYEAGTVQWRIQEAYNTLWTWEEVEQFHSNQNACYRNWLGKTIKHKNLEDIIFPCLQQHMEWYSSSNHGGYQRRGTSEGHSFRPSLILLKASDAWMTRHSIPLFRPNPIPTQAFHDQPMDCTINLL